MLAHYGSTGLFSYLIVIFLNKNGATVGAPYIYAK